MVHEKSNPIRLLITAFEPFNQQSDNSSLDVLNHLSIQMKHAEIIKRVLPVTYDHLRYSKLIESERPTIILHLGEASNRDKISLERRAVNLMHASIPDNLGTIKQNELILSNGPNELFSTIPIESLYESLFTLGLPIEISDSAGQFICNQALYCSLNHVREHQLNIQVGFIHFPRLNHQVNKPGMISLPLETALNTLENIIQRLVH